MDNSIIQQRYQSQSKDRSPYGRAVNYGSNDAYRGDALRNSAYQQPIDQNSIDEEELYNRRRDEEIRRHVQARESSSEMQSSHYSNKHKPSERIRSRLDQSQNGQNQNGQINSQPYETFGNSLPSRDKSPYSNNGMIAKDEGIPSYVKEHIANIQSDNQSLMRRLGLVEQELDRVHREKNELYERSAIISQESTELQKLINLEDNVDKANRHIHDDINYEKDRGMGLRQRLKDSELIKHDIIIKLRKIEDKQDNFASQNQAQQSELQMKLSHISDIEKEHYYTQEKIKQVNNYIDKLRLEAHQENREKSEIQAELNLVHAERDDLLNKLDHLTSKYDECVQEITHDREDMEISNNRHEKLVAAKIIFQELETVSRNKVRSGIDDIKNYCDFDRKCHGKLQLLANVMLKIGKYQLKNAMTQWFSNSLKPINIKLQSLALSGNMYTNKLKQRMFYMWFKKYDKRINSYEDKTTAVKQIWLIHQRDTQIELKRSFTIWRDILKRGSLKRMKVKKLIWRLYFNKLSTAMCIWQQYSSIVDNQVRLNLLAQQFSQKQYMTLLFNNFKHETIDRKRKRHNIAFHVIKAWQDYIRHRKFLMGASLNAIHYKKQHNVSLIKACYDAIRQYKEQSKHDKINEELTQDVLPEIESLNQEISERSVNKNFKNKEKACKSVKVMLSKQLYTYFNQWKQANESYQYKLRTTVKDKIIKVYIDQLRKAFVLWHANSDGNKINSQQCIVEDLQGNQSNLTEEVVTMQKEVKDKTQQLDQSQNRKLNKSLISYQKRMKQIAIGRWKDNIEIQNVKENGSDFILKKIRARLLRSAFDLYKSGSDYKKKLDIEEERYRYLINTRNERLKRRVYNSWHLYRTNFIKAKTYWNRIYIKMDLVMKNLAMRRWKEESQLILESSLENSQNEVINHIEIKNAELGQLHTQEQSIQQQNNNIKSRMTKQAQRVLANTIAKYYYIGHTRGFEKWKEFTTFEQRRERLMKKMINHWRMYQFQNVKTTFQRWMVNSDIELKQQSLKKEEQRLEGLNFQHQQQQQQFKGENQHIDEELLQIQGQQKMYNFRLQKSVQLIVGKVDGNYYLSQKRYILTQWRDYVKREKHFILCIKNVIQKSMWQRGFNEIRGAARGVTREDKLLQVLNRFRIKFWKRTCSNTFSQWKTGAYKTIMSHIEDVTEETNLYVEDHQNKVVVRKQENAVKSAKIVKQNHTANIFNNWKYITKQIKLLRIKNLKYNDNAEVYNKQIAIIKWNRRVKATKLARNRMLRLKNKFQKIRKMLVFNGMKKIFFAAKDFMSRISNLANIHDQQALKIGYNSIQSYVRAKNYVYGKKKEHASKDFVSLLNNLLSRKMGTYLRDLKYKTSLEYKQNLHKAFTVFQKLNGRLRSYFLRWKQENEFRKLAQELNEEGPIRELWFEERQLLENCKKFMKDEGYSQRDIEQALKSGNLEKKTQILKSIRRMQHYNVDLNSKPRMFDRWRQYVHIRKLFKYWLQFVDRRSSHVQSDLARSFDRWKNYESSQKRDLVKMPKKQLDQKIINNSNRLDNLAENINNKENMLQHLDAQRETLVDNYIKGQKLALGLLLNNNKRSLHKAFLKWSRSADNTKSDTLETRLRKQVETIAALKEKLREVEIDNESLANENEELRQFSLDGYEIAKNVQVLSLEREKLSVDLADKSQIIRKLLDENEVLTNCLHQAQSEAQKLIKSTNSKYY